MNLESILPFLLILLPFGIAFFIEALVIYFSRAKRFWPALGISLLINLLVLVLLYGASLLLSKLGYEFNGLLLPLQVTLFFWWLSIIGDGLLLHLFLQRTEKHRVYLTSIVMNSLSYLFVYFFISNSH